MSPDDPIEDYFNRQEKILKSLTSIIRGTGVKLISAKKVKSNLLTQDEFDSHRKSFTSKRISLKSENYDELQERSQSFLHREMVDESVDYFLIRNYKVYKGGVGIKGIYTFADFVAEKERSLTFGECLTGASLKISGILYKKSQLSKYGKICFIVPHTSIKTNKTKQSLIQISDMHNVLVYFNTGFGTTENHLVDLNTYLWHLEISNKLPHLSASVHKKGSLLTLKIQFDCRLPKELSSVELKETWRVAITHSIFNLPKSIFASVRLKHSNNKYLFNLEPKDFSNPRYTSRDMLTIRILDSGVEISIKNKWGLDLFKEQFLPQLQRKGINTELQKFINSLK